MKCIIVEKVKDKITGEFYKPKKDKKGNDVPQEVNQEFYDRAIKTKYIKAVEKTPVENNPEETVEKTPVENNPEETVEKTPVENNPEETVEKETKKTKKADKE